MVIFCSMHVSMHVRKFVELFCVPMYHCKCLVNKNLESYNFCFIEFFVDNTYNNYNGQVIDRDNSKYCILTFLDHLLVQGRPVFESSSIFGLVPCLQSVGISSCLPVCCPSISFSVGLGSFSQRPLVLVILHRCGWVLASSSGQTTLVFCFPGKFYMGLLPDVFISDVVQPGLPSCPSQHPHFC